MLTSVITEFNLGSKAYKSGKIDKAIKHFTQAMDSVFQRAVSGVDIKAIAFKRFILSASISCALAKCYVKKAETNIDYIENVNQMLNLAKLYFAKSQKYKSISRKDITSKASRQLNQKNEIVDSIYEINVAKMDLYWNNASSKINEFAPVLDNPTALQTVDTEKKKMLLLNKLEQVQAIVHDELTEALRQAKLLRSNGHINNILNLLANFHERVADVFSTAYDDPKLNFDQESSLNAMLTNYQFAFDALQSTRNNESNEQLLGLYRSVLNVLEMQSFLAERKGNVKEAIEICNEILRFTKKLDLDQFSQEQLTDCKQEIMDYTTKTQQRLTRYAKLNEQKNFNSNPVALTFSRSLNPQISRDFKEMTETSLRFPIKKRFNII